MTSIWVPLGLLNLLSLSDLLFSFIVGLIQEFRLMLLVRYGGTVKTCGQTTLVRDMIVRFVGRSQNTVKR